MFLVALIGSALAQFAEASFFLHSDGQYELTIDVPGEWDAAQVMTTLNGVMEIHDWPDDGLSLKGHVANIPDGLWVSLQLEHGDSGKDILLMAPTILIPRAMPNLGGKNKVPLPPISFYWKADRFLHKLFSQP